MQTLRYRIAALKGAIAIFVLYAGKNQLTVHQREPVTSGSVNVYPVRFEFSPDWVGLTRTAVFKAGTESRSVLLDYANVCEVPWEVLVKPNVQLQAGIYGTLNGNVVLPTIWASLGVILEGVTTGESAQPPTPNLWRQELAGKGDTLGYTEAGELGLYSKDKLLSAVPVQGSGAGGTADHRLLTGRDAERQHPIDAIEGLANELSRIPEPVEALTNFDLEALLK